MKKLLALFSVVGLVLSMAAFADNHEAKKADKAAGTEHEATETTTTTTTAKKAKKDKMSHGKKKAAHGDEHSHDGAAADHKHE